ncbi:MAG: VanZ family protein [Gammaproteobacteria bacterium]|nr:VanZ family protein [Gammaproteobacteria bacterium]
MHATPAINQLRYPHLWWGVGILILTAIITVSLLNNPLILKMAESDKIGHILTYALLMGWFSQILNGFLSKLLWGALFILLGVILELLQQRIGMRISDIGDMVANAIGVVLGAVIFHFIGNRLLLKIERIFT